MRGGASKEKGRKALAWGSLAFAFAAGAGAAFTFVGSLVTAILAFLPLPWLPPALLGGLVVAAAVDIFLDGEPNQVALYSAMAVPSIAIATPGKLADTVGQLAGQVQTGLSVALGSWLGVSAGFGFVAVCGTVAYFMGRRVVAKSGGGGGR